MTDAAAAAPAGTAPAAVPAGQNGKASVQSKNVVPAGKAGGPAASAKPAASPPPDKIRGKDGAAIPDDIEELKRGYGHMQAANEKMKLAAEKEKAADAKLAQAGELEAAFKAAEQGDFTQLVRKVGYTKAKEFAEMLLLAEIEWNEMTPEQQRAKQLERENEQYKRRDADAKAKADKAKAAADEQRAFEDIDTEVTGALKELGKTPTPRVVARVVEYLLADIESDETKARPVSAKDAYKRVVNDLHGEMVEYGPSLPVEQKASLVQAMLKDLSEADLQIVLGEEISDRARQVEVNKVLAQDPLRSGRRIERTSDESSTDRKRRIPHEDFWKRKEKKYGGRR